MHIVYFYLLPGIAAALAFYVALRWSHNQDAQIQTATSPPLAPTSTMNGTLRQGIVLPVCALIAAASFGLSRYAMEHFANYLHGHETPGVVTWLDDKQRLRGTGPEVWTELTYEYLGETFQFKATCDDEPQLKLGDKLTVLVDVFHPEVRRVLRPERAFAQRREALLFEGALGLFPILLCVWLGSTFLTMLPRPRA